MKKLKVVGILLVLLVLALVVPASAEVVTESTGALSVSISAPSEVKVNGFNYVTLTFKNTASYPVSARVVLIPSYFALKPDWVSVDAMKTGSGVTFTLHNIPAGNEKTVKLVIPGDVLEGLKTENGEIMLFKMVKVYPFAGSGATASGVEAKNLQVLSVDAPTSKAFEETIELVFPIVMVLIGFALATVGAKYLS